LRPALGGALAVAGGAVLRIHPAWGLIAVCGGVVIVFCCWSDRRARAVSLLALVLLAWAGYRATGPLPPLEIALNQPLRFRGEVISDPRRTPDGLKMEVRVEAFAPAPPQVGWTPRSARVLLSVRGLPEREPGRGDKVVFRASLRAGRGFRNPGTSWYGDYLLRRKIDARAYASWPGTVLFARPGSSAPWLNRARRELARAIREAAPGDTGAVLRAMVLGDRSAVTPGLAQTFRRTGTAHLLAVSGFHLGVVALLALALFRRLFPPFAFAGPRRPSPGWPCCPCL